MVQHETIRSLSKENFDAVDQVDTRIPICPDDSSHSFTGANVEVGYAMAKNKRIFSVGVLQRSAMYVPVEKFKSITDLLPVLEDLGS